jgi:hypothetical protein
MGVRARKITACAFSSIVSLANLVIAVLAISIMVQGIIMLNTSLPPQNAVDQILEDWAVTPFVQITVRSADCLADEEPVFQMDYEGVNNGYLCNGGTTVSLQPEGSDCSPIEGFGAILTTKFYNLHICGRRGGKRFN